MWKWLIGKQKPLNKDNAPSITVDPNAQGIVKRTPEPKTADYRYDPDSYRFDRGDRG